MVEPISWPHFCFIGVVVNLNIDKVIGLAIDRAVLMGRKITISFSKLFF